MFRIYRFIQKNHYFIQFLHSQQKNIHLKWTMTMKWLSSKKKLNGGYGCIITITKLMEFGSEFSKKHLIYQLSNMMKLLMMRFAMGGLMDREKSLIKNLFCKNSHREEKKVIGQNEIHS